MIPASIRARQPSTGSSWQQQLAAAISSPAELLEVLGLAEVTHDAKNNSMRAL